MEAVLFCEVLLVQCPLALKPLHDTVDWSRVRARLSPSPCIKQASGFPLDPVRHTLSQVWQEMKPMPASTSGDQNALQVREKVDDEVVVKRVSIPAESGPDLTGNQFR